MTSHTTEPASFWEQLDVPRLHAVWFMDESIRDWLESRSTGMSKGSIQHLYVMAEARGASECLTSGGTNSGHRSGEEILPLPDRIRRIVGRAGAWMALRQKENSSKRIAIVGYDHHANRSHLLCGQQLGLNAPRSMLVLLRALAEAGYSTEDLPGDEEALLDRLADHGRQLGSWQPAELDRIARSGKAVLIPAERYRNWFERKVPYRERQDVVEAWGEPPGKLMVWHDEGIDYLVLPQLAMGEVVLLTQPPKGEALSATTDMLPTSGRLTPSHHFLATYFWLQEGFQADAVIHFGAHGNEWLFSGNNAALSSADWGDVLLGDLPNINPWSADNVAELLPCKRRAYALTIGHLPSLLMEAGLDDELLNLESTIQKYTALDNGALKTGFAKEIADLVRSQRLDRELHLGWDDDGVLDDRQIQQVGGYLHRRRVEAVPASMHVLGSVPEDDVLLPYLVHCMGAPWLAALEQLFDCPESELRRLSISLLSDILREHRPPLEAFRAAGAKLDGDALPAAINEGLELVTTMDAGMQRCGEEVDSILKALRGGFIAPGPAGAPERNPAVVPTGRNLFALNPEELPARSSWELGTGLMCEYLQTRFEQTGSYPQKIAFGLVPYATYSDYGIIESQILYLLGVRPLWDSRNRVTGLEVIPREELGRPRIDVFLSVKSVYREELPGMMRLLDRAVRLVAKLDEPDNVVFAHTLQTREDLLDSGMAAPQARSLASARLYGTRPDETVDGHDWYFYLTERSGEWDDRRQLVETYLQHCRNVYTEGMWGVPAEQSFAAAVQGTELIMRSWYDERDTVLSNKFAWWSEGSLSLAIKQITGEEPACLFVDVRDSETAGVVDAELAMRRDLRSRLLNPRWISAVMEDGYSGASQISRNVDNLMGWKIMRDGSISDADFAEVTDVIIHDREELGLRAWFEDTNPYALQDVNATLLETVRKGFWSADASTVDELTMALANSVVQHGSSGGLRQGGNAKLQGFVEETLGAMDTPQAAELLAAYRAALVAEATAVVSATQQVRGRRMDRVTTANDQAASRTPVSPYWLVAVIVGLLIGAGFIFNRSRR